MTRIINEIPSIVCVSKSKKGNTETGVDNISENDWLIMCDPECHPESGKTPDCTPDIWDECSPDAVPCDPDVRS